MFVGSAVLIGKAISPEQANYMVFTLFGVLVIVPTLLMLIASERIETNINHHHRHDHYLHDAPRAGGPQHQVRANSQQQLTSR